MPPFEETTQDTEENLEIIDIRNSAKANNGWIQTIIGDISKASTAKQLTAGGLSGWCTGYLFTKVGKVAATALAGSIFLFQFAQYKGYIKVNWTRVNTDLNQAKIKLEKQAKDRLPYIIENGRQIVEDNVILATGFAGGFFLGMASA